jgi:hypothetical protein
MAGREAEAGSDGGGGEQKKCQRVHETYITSTRAARYVGLVQVRACGRAGDDKQDGEMAAEVGRGGLGCMVMVATTDTMRYLRVHEAHVTSIWGARNMGFMLGRARGDGSMGGSGQATAVAAWQRAQ